MQLVASKTRSKQALMAREILGLVPWKDINCYAWQWKMPNQLVSLQRTFEISLDTESRCDYDDYIDR